jgi:metalloendopeptidase OMA1, mitochondrial
MNPEIGHVTARHNSEKVSSAQVGLVISTLLVAVLGIDFGLSRFLQTYLLELPGDRRVELEADAIGLRLMSKACYRPEAAAEYVPSSFFAVLYLSQDLHSNRMFTRMGEMEAKSGRRMNVDWMYTHPTSDTRVKVCIYPSQP